jgi:aminopeptidase N
MIAATSLLGVLFAAQPPPAAGISEELANERAAAISSLRYELSFRIPEKKTEAVEGTAKVQFQLRTPQNVVLDFAERSRIRAVRIGGSPAAFQFANGHIILPASATRTGENAIEIAFVAGDESLNRNDDYLFTLFVPARAHLAFPCFDQPNLKARYSLTLEIPASWQAVANGAESSQRAVPGGRRIVQFAETKPLSTYLFAFAAGQFQVEVGVRNGRTFRMFHRETDSAKVARNRDAVFDLHARALAWLEEYTGIPYQWGKFDFVLIPAFQFGGMEHAGAIFYNAANLLLEPSATQNEMLARANVISHETSHMWFGDLVTMRWFNDVWMKEVMANFMAAKIVNPSFPKLNHELRFLLSHYPAAYAVDRTAGTNPIRQQLANLNEAGTMYGAIIYEKAPIVMRQLEQMLGQQGFRDGLREYLKKYSFGNATWLDLIAVLGRGPGTGKLAAWSHAWVEERGRPEVTTTVRTGSDGKAAQISISQRDPLDGGVVWPQALQVAFGYPERVELVPLLMDSTKVELPKAKARPAPLYVLPNGAGVGYGLFVLDDATRNYLLGHLEQIPDALTRGSAWVDLWENLLEHRVRPGEFLDLAMRALPQETDELNRQAVLNYTASAFWHWLPAGERAERAPKLESLLRGGMARASSPAEKAPWFHTYRDTVLTREGLAWLERVWRRQEKIEGLTLGETEEITMAQNLALREVPGARQLLSLERDRIANPDRKARFEFSMPALSGDPAERDRSFARFRDAANRRHEPWVLDCLTFLNHPLREEHARQFIRPSLEMLPEIQRTGDIFFPSRWTAAVLGGHRSVEAAGVVRDFLAKNPGLPERLRWIVLTAADDLFRSGAAPR